MTILAYFVVRDEDGNPLAWESRTEAPCLHEVPGTRTAIAAAGQSQRVYVNGVPVATSAVVVRPGDFVRVYSGEAEVVSYRFGGVVARNEEGEGRVCCFSGEPIRGRAVVCTGASCQRAFAADVATELGKCPVCGASLETGAAADSLGTAPLPPEELM